MGTASSVLQTEIARPADGSDVAGSPDAARAEVVRLRAVLRAQAEAAGVKAAGEEDSTVEVWEYRGKASNGAGTVFGTYHFRRVLFDRGTGGEPPSVTLDVEYVGCGCWGRGWG